MIAGRENGVSFIGKWREIYSDIWRLFRDNRPSGSWDVR
jgi:hypothetical protein